MAQQITFYEGCCDLLSPFSLSWWKDGAILSHPSSLSLRLVSKAVQ